MNFFKSKKFYLIIFLIFIFIIRTIYSYYLYNFKYYMEEEKYIEAEIMSIYSRGENFDGYLCKLKYSGKFRDRFVVY